MKSTSVKSDEWLFGIDLGGTKIELIVLDSHGMEIWRRRKPTPQGDYVNTLNTVKICVEEAEKELCVRAEKIGIGTPGAISPATGRLKNANSVCLNGRPLLEDMRYLLARPVRIANDADCFALSEASDGSAAPFSVVFGVILGTGVGGGIVVHGRLLQGPNAIAGEWGHNPLPWSKADEHPGPQCYCGKKGCIETFLSGPGLQKEYIKQTGQMMEGPEIMNRASAGEAISEEVVQRYENRLARALSHIINVLDPDAIVLGGGLSNCARLYENIPRQWNQYVFSDRVDTQLIPPHYGDSSGVRGAAWLWKE